MGLLKKAKSMIQSFDLFSHQVGFQFDESSEYQSVTGGFLSLIIIVLFIAIFAGTAVNTFNKLYINSEHTFFEQ